METLSCFVLWNLIPPFPLPVLPQICFAFPPHVSHREEVRGRGESESLVAVVVVVDVLTEAIISRSPSAPRPRVSAPFPCLMWPQTGSHLTLAWAPTKVSKGV